MKEFKIGNITLINGDCMEYMAAIADKSFELAIVDPPYQLSGKSVNHSRHSGSGKLKNRTLNRNAKKFRQWDIAPTAEYFEQLYRVSGNQIIWGGNYFNLPPTRGIVCWDKCQPWPNFSQVELAWTSFDKPAKLFKYDNRRGGKIHPCQSRLRSINGCWTNMPSRATESLTPILEAAARQSRRMTSVLSLSALR